MLGSGLPSDDDDPQKLAAHAVWKQIYVGELATPLQLSTSTFCQCQLGDLLAFLLAFGGSPKTGSLRLLGLAFDILSQLGPQLGDMIRRHLHFHFPLPILFFRDMEWKNLFFCRSMCDAQHQDLPMVRFRQRHRRKDVLDDEHDAEQGEFGEDDGAIRRYVLATLMDGWKSLANLPSKSLTVVTDAADVGDAHIALFFAFSSAAGKGFMLPHQVRPPRMSCCFYACLFGCL